MIRTLLLASVCLCLLPACDTNAGQDEFFLESQLSPSGITRTSASGEILGESDPDDWRVAPAFQGSVEVVPASPNPVDRNGLVTIVVQDTFDDALTGGVRATGFTDTNPRQFVELDRDDGNGPFYTLTFSPTLLRQTGGDAARLFRIRIFTTDSRIVSYGDIEVR
ncbi:MAG: hypothetical protein ABJF88_03325 [Rhodothermales bacterium]